MSNSTEAIHLGSLPDESTLDLLADFICGDDTSKYPIYRSSMNLSMFFDSVGINAKHDGSTRKWWVLGILKQLDPGKIERVILKLVDFKVYRADRQKHRTAVQSMNDILLIESLYISFNGATPMICRGKAVSFQDEDFSRPPDSLVTETDFLTRQFPESIIIDELGVDPVITNILQDRVNEIKACQKENTPLALIFLLGSTLEGVLLATAVSRPRAFQGAIEAPRVKNGAVRPLQEWKLNDLINVAHEIGLVDLDVKKHSHTLREFRNYIHPYRQMAEKFSPDQHTVEIGWQVFRAVFHQLKKNSPNLP